jgi:integrase/recombinase XerD
MASTVQFTRENVRKKLPHYLERHEIEILIRYAAHRSKIASNFMLTMWRAGLRVTEAVNLEARDLRFGSDSPQIHIRRAKGHKERYVPAHQELVRTLSDHCLYIRATGNDRLFFVERSGANLTRQRGYEWVISALAGAVDDEALPKGTKVTPHTFRHSAARHWLHNGVAINTVQTWLGHSNLTTTLIYLQLNPSGNGVMQNIP